MSGQRRSAPSPARVVEAEGARAPDVPPPELRGAEVKGELQTVGAPPDGKALTVYDWGGREGGGYENVGVSEKLTPILAVLHYQCPQIDEADPGWVEGARPGMFFNTSSGDLLDGKVGVPFLACAVEHLYTVWRPRGKSGGGGGFRGTRPLNDPVALELRRKYAFQRMPYDRWEVRGGAEGEFERVEFVEQYNLWVVYADEQVAEAGAERPPLVSECRSLHAAVVPFASKRIKPVRAFISQLDDKRYPHAVTGRMVKPPMWAHACRMYAVPDSNDAGKFFNIRLGLAVPGRSHLSLVPQDCDAFAMADELNAAWRRSDVRADYEGAEGAEGADDEHGPPM